jgi:hypothetical protein
MIGSEQKPVMVLRHCEARVTVRLRGHESATRSGVA